MTTQSISSYDEAAQVQPNRQPSGQMANVTDDHNRSAVSQVIAMRPHEGQEMIPLNSADRLHYLLEQTGTD